MSKSSIKKNFSYNIIYQMLVIVLPLITAPYVSRVIGAEGNGIYSYTYSIAYYFALFAMLGINNYGNRTIAKCRDNKEILSKEFWSIYALQLITCIISIVAYILYITIFDNKYFTYALIQLIYLVSVCFDINWLFFGLEKFKITVTKNAVIKLLTALSIFIFVKDENDLAKYAILMTSVTLLSQLALWPFVKKEVTFVKPKIKDIVRHIKPNIILFIPVVAVSLYKMMDKVMLGSMSNIEEVAYFEYAERILNIPTGIITALGTVMLPRMSNLIAQNDKSKTEFYIDKSMEFAMLFSISVCFGLMAISEEFIPIFLGEDFIQTGIIVKYLAPTIIFTSIANVIRTQYLMPNEKDKDYIISVFLGAIVNFVVNMITIPRYQAIGAAIGTLAAEFSVMLYQIIVVRKKINIKKYTKDLVKIGISGAIMYLIVISLKKVISNNYILIVVQVIIGVIVYMLLNYRYILNNIQFIPILNKLKKERKV